jgi:hypothetical protein
MDSRFRGNDGGRRGDGRRIGDEGRCGIRQSRRDSAKPRVFVYFSQFEVADLPYA